jgi:hypothetical protein
MTAYLRAVATHAQLMEEQRKSGDDAESDFGWRIRQTERLIENARTAFTAHRKRRHRPLPNTDALFRAP